MRVQHNSRRSGAVRFGRILLVAVVAALVLAACILYARRKPAKEEGLALPFSLQTVGGFDSDFAIESATPISDGLVVCQPDVPIEGVYLSRGEEAALLFDLGENRAVFADGIYTPMYPASLTKIMTAILVLERGSLGEVVTMEEGDFALEAEAQVSGLMPGDKISVEQLLHGLLVYSANDAAMALARTIGGSIPRFVTLMNEHARELGMTGTHFTNPHGLHEDDLVTTPYDVYLMMRDAYRHEKFSEISRLPSCELTAQTESGTERSIFLYSTDFFLTRQEELPSGISILASKTGSTAEAGYCLALITQNDLGIPYLSVVMNAPTYADLYGDMRTLLQQINNS